MPLTVLSPTSLTLRTIEPPGTVYPAEDLFPAEDLYPGDADFTLSLTVLTPDTP